MPASSFSFAPQRLCPVFTGTVCRAICRTPCRKKKSRNTCPKMNPSAICMMPSHKLSSTSTLKLRTRYTRLGPRNSYCPTVSAIACAVATATAPPNTCTISSSRSSRISTTSPTRSIAYSRPTSGKESRTRRSTSHDQSTSAHSFHESRSPSRPAPSSACPPDCSRPPPSLRPRGSKPDSPPGSRFQPRPSDSDSPPIPPQPESTPAHSRPRSPPACGPQYSPARRAARAADRQPSQYFARNRELRPSTSKPQPPNSSPTAPPQPCHSPVSYSSPLLPLAARRPLSQDEYQPSGE